MWGSPVSSPIQNWAGSVSWLPLFPEAFIPPRAWLLAGVEGMLPSQPGDLPPEILLLCVTGPALPNSPPPSTALLKVRY